MMKDHCLLPCLCVYRNMNLIIPPHPTPAVTDDERPLPVAVPVCVLEHNLIIPPHPTRAETDDERPLPVAVPVRVCVCVCVYWNMNVITPPHPTPAVTDDERPLPAACVCTGT